MCLVHNEKQKMTTENYQIKEKSEHLEKRKLTNTSGDEKRIKRMRKLLKTKLHCRNLITKINIWAIPLVRYSGPFLKRMREELQQMNKKTQKLMHKALHLRDNVDKLYMLRKESRRGLASIQDSIDASRQWL